jgi:hypothetical protein
MKKPLINIYENLLRTRYNEVRYLNRFIRNWGTEVQGGEEVFRLHNYWYWPGNESNAFRPLPVDQQVNCNPETKEVCEEVIVGHTGENDNGIVGEPIYETQCRQVLVNEKDNTPGGMPGKCTQERKLFESLDVWEQLRDSSKKGLDWAWMYLNPANMTDISRNKDLVVDNFNKYLEKSKDKQGRITFKIRVVTSDAWIPGVDSFKYSPNNEYNANILQLIGTSNYEMVEEEIYLLDKEGEILLDKEGKPRKIKELVKDNVQVKQQINSNQNLWNSHAMLAVQDVTVDIYEKLLARYLLTWGDTSKMRVSYVGRSLVQYERTEQADEGLFGGYTSFMPDGGYITYGGANRQTWGSSYVATYHIPVYEITYVVRDYPEIEVDDALVDKLVEDVMADYYIQNTDYDGITAESVVETVYGKVNGFLSYSTLKGSYPENDDPEIQEKNNNRFAFMGYTSSVFLTNPEYWVEGLFAYGKQQYYLKKEVLSTGKYIKKRKDRIRLLSVLLDTGYEEKSSSGSIFSIIIIIIVIIVAVITQQYYAAKGALYSLAAAVVAASLVITIATAVADGMGMYGDAQFLAQMNRTLAPFVQVATIIITVQTGINVANSLKGAATTAASMTAEQMVSKVMEWAGEKIKNVTLSQGLQVASTAFDFISKNELADLERKNKSKQKQVQEYEEAKEQEKYSPLLMEASAALLDPLRMIGTSYEFDRPFEPVFGRLHSGNSCRTTVVALMGDGNKTYTNNTV